MLSTFKERSFEKQLSFRSFTDASSVSTVSATATAAPLLAARTNQQAMMHLIPDMMVLPSEPIHGQRMMLPAVWDASHHCFVLSVNTQPVLVPGYQFVYPAVQMTAQWMYPQPQGYSVQPYTGAQMEG